MQSATGATQHYAGYPGPGYDSDPSHVPDFASLGFDTDALTSLLDDFYTSNPTAWHGSLMLDSEYATAPSSAGPAFAPSEGLSQDASIAVQT